MKRADDFVAWKGGGSLRFVGTNKGRYESAPMKQLFIDLLNDDQKEVMKEVMMNEHLLQELTDYVRLVTQLDQVYIADNELKGVVARQMLKLCTEVVDYVVQKSASMRGF